MYVPTNQLYLGNLVVCPASAASFPDLTVEQGIRIFLTGGMALPPELHAHAAMLPLHPVYALTTSRPPAYEMMSG